MGPPDPTRDDQDVFRQVLGDPSLRGDRLLEAIAVAGHAGLDAPFRSCLNSIVSVNLDEPAARDMVLAVEAHRDDLQRRLGRDPGFTVAAFDLMFERERVLREPVFRDAGRPAGPAVDPAGPAAESFEETLRLEARRAGRTGRPLAAVALRAAGTVAQDDGGLARLRDAARDIDAVAALPAGGYAVLLPGAGGRAGLRAADRYRRALEEAAATPFRAGVAADAGRTIDGRALWRGAMTALEEAERSGVTLVLHRAERRDHRRLPVGPSVAARMRSAGDESDVVVEDLSLGGALLSTGRRIDPGGEILLAVRGGLSRPPALMIPSRVLRVQDGPTPGRPPWRAAVTFRGEARLRVAALLADLRNPDDAR